MDDNFDLTKNPEIQNALREFEEKSKEELPPAPIEKKKQRGLVEWLMGHFPKIFKEQRHAEYFLLGVVVVALGLSFFLMWGNKAPSSTNPPFVDDSMLPAEF